MRLLIISPMIFPCGGDTRYQGIERLVSLFTQELARRGHQVSVAAPQGSLFPKGVKHLNAGPCGDFVEAEKRAYAIYRPYLGAFEAILDFSHSHWAMRELDLPAIALIWHAPSVMQPPLPTYNVAALSEFQRMELRSYQGISSRVIDPHCVDPKNYLPYQGGERYVFLGRPNPEKGVREAVTLCRELDVGLDIIGGVGPGDPPEYLEWIKANLTPKMVYWGAVSDGAKFEFIAQAKALLHPVLSPEAHSHKCVDFSCGGVPIVAYSRGANSEIIEHGVTGFLARNREEFKEGMLKVGELDPELIRQKALSRWAVDEVVGRWEVVLEEVANGERWGETHKQRQIYQVPSQASFVKYSLPPQPRQIRLDTINACNARCPACHLHFQTTKKGGQMSMELLNKALDDIASWPKPLEEIVPVNFGEFFLRKDWCDILKLVERRLPKTRIALPTNGSLMDNAAVGQIASISTVKWVNFSINAFFKETYEQFTGLGVEVIDRIKRAAELLRFLRPDIVTCASMIFDSAYQSELERDKFIEFWRPLVSLVSINHAVYCNSPLKKPVIPVKTACRSIFDGLVVLYDGTVVTGCCWDSSGKLVLDKFPNQTLLQIWQGEGLGRLTQLHNQGKREEIELLCRMCGFA